MLDVPALVTTEHIGIKHNDAPRHLMSSSRHLWRLPWGGCFNLERMGIQESMYCLPNAEVQAMKNICEIDMYRKSYNSLFVFLLTLFLSGLRNVQVHHR